MQTTQESDSETGHFSAEDRAAFACAKDVLNIPEEDMFPKYGCAMLRTQGCAHSHLLLIGLDGWKFDAHL